MNWSVIKSFGNWRELIGMMLDKARKYVICDIRIANADFEAFDDQVCWADYGGKRGPISFVNYPTYRDALVEHKNELDRVEFAAYQSEWDDFVHLREKLELLKRTGIESMDVFFKWYNWSGIITLKSGGNDGS